MSTSIRVFTDGACRGNPGPGGWGALILHDQDEFSLWGGEKETTNNQMEMTKKPVKNKELWMRLDQLTQFHNVSWNWVKGHSGHRENEIADMLANKGIDEL